MQSLLNALSDGEIALQSREPSSAHDVCQPEILNHSEAKTSTPHHGLVESDSLSSTE